jgi:hypothetical protein
MWLFRRGRRATQDALHIARTDKHLTSTGSMTACALAAIAACLLVFSAASQNVGYAYTLGLATSTMAAYMLAAASAGASILGPCAWMVVFGRRVPLGRRGVALLLAVGCLAYAGTCSLGYVHGARTGAISGQQTAADQYGDVRALKRAAIAELGTLKGQSPAVLKRRAELMAILSSKASAAAVQPGSTDAQAAALGFYIRAAGYKVSDDAVGTWLSLGMVAFLELAAGLSFAVVAALYPTTRKAAPEARTEAPAPQAPTVAPKPETAASAQETRPARDDKDDNAPPPAAPRSRGKAGRPAAVGATQAVERLRKAGGSANGSIATVGKLLGAKSKSTAHRVLRRLAEAGQVHYRATPQGVSVALV